MRVRTQLAVVAMVAAGWSAGNVTRIDPLLASGARMDRATLGALEGTVARAPDNVDAARALAAAYLEQQVDPHAVIGTIARLAPAAQQDGRVTLALAVAHERLGELQRASALLAGATGRCELYAANTELALAAGCDVRTTTDLAIESGAVDWMLAHRVDPVAEPERIAFAREMARHPVRFVAGGL